MPNPITIAANVVFRAGSGLHDMAMWGRRTARLIRLHKDFGMAAKLSGVELKEFVNVVNTETKQIRAQKATTGGQRWIKLLTTAIRVSTGAFKEFRFTVRGVYRLFRGSPPRRAAKTMVKDLQQVKTVAKQTAVQMNEVLAVFGGVVAGFTGMNIAGNFKQFIGEGVSLAASDESSLVTFDVLLGSQKKSQELLKRISTFSASTPFQRSDILEGSKKLLNVSKDDLDMNEKLFKLASSIAALRPGKKVAEVAQGIVNASVGEFDTLKSGFGLLLKSDDFKSLGEPGGKAYVDGVMKAIEDRFMEKTGGRGDKLVEVLSRTLNGKISTMVDNLEMLQRFLGELFIEMFDVKSMIDGITNFVNEFLFVFQVTMGKISLIEDNEAFNRFMGTSTFMRSLAIFVKNIIDHVKWGWDFLVNRVVKPAYNWLASLGPKLQQFLIMIGVGASSAALGGGILIPIMTAIGVVGSTTVAILSPFAYVIIPAVKAAIASLLGILSPTTSMIGAIALGFFLFRRNGEGVVETFQRLGTWVQWFADITWQAAKAFWGPFMDAVGPQVRANFGHVIMSLQGLKEPLDEFFGYFGGQRITSLKDFAELGKNLGWVFSKVLAWAADKSVKNINRLAILLKWASEQQFIRSLASDFLNLGRAFFDLVLTGNMSSKGMKLFMLSLIDIITTPFRMMLSKLADLMQQALASLIPIVGGYNARLTGMLTTAVSGVAGLKSTLNEGFVGTEFNIPVTFDINGQDTMIVETKIDGEKVGETMLTREMRARHSGRGGNPVNPEEQGFVMESGGNSIRSVSLTEASELL